MKSFFWFWGWFQVAWFKYEYFYSCSSVHSFLGVQLLVNTFTYTSNKSLTILFLQVFLPTTNQARLFLYLVNDRLVPWFSIIWLYHFSVLHIAAFAIPYHIFVFCRLSKVCLVTRYTIFLTFKHVLKLILGLFTYFSLLFIPLLHFGNSRLQVLLQKSLLIIILNTNHAENVHQKLVPEPFLIFLYKLKQLLHARNSFKNKIFWKRIIKNP